MHTHQRLSAAAALGAALLLASSTAALAHTPSPRAGAPLPRCAERDLSVHVAAAPTPDVLKIRFTNNGPRACTVDRIPTVTFGDLDGAARPEPPVGSAPYTVRSGASAYATVRTVLAPPTPADVRTVRDIVVAADPAHHGKRVTAAQLGLPKGVRVYDPVTSLWGPAAPSAR
ncbi:DUF4232 domain-containing protein [Streptomyces sp. NPDC004111]|uniref:DUF4232 domain-containing protein n=1 Tax=Streptomyces sp. NPDC004111 TaxID=3364690 RepID=UPI003681D0F0